jgi:HEAT repeat protein
VRSGAAKALGQVGAPAEAALPVLKELARSDAAETVRKAAGDAVTQIKPRRWFSF